MRKLVAVGLVLALVAGCGPIKPPDRAVAEGSGVEGYVHDETGAPLEVEVSVIDSVGRSVLAKDRTYASGIDGRYRVPAPPGAWTVTFFRPGYAFVKLPVVVRDGLFVRVDAVVSPSRPAG